ncbi:MAG TPA: hypothetical protein VJ841_04935 [Candidatus Saccharimonadales bacterium]|nr:hypothetical protein [Candidatus Saccharimonadales bacterium]
MSKSEAASQRVDAAVLTKLRQEFRNVSGELALWDLVRVCRDPDFVITNPESKMHLINVGLVEKFDEGRAVVPESVRSTVTSTVVGEGLSLQIRTHVTR